MALSCLSGATAEPFPRQSTFHLMRRISNIAVMPSPPPAGQRFFGGAVAISLILHAVVVVALVGGMDWQLAETEEVSISVELVPPPESEAPEPLPQPEDQLNSEQKTAELQPTVPVLQPVIEFAETDSGPRIDPEGESEQQASQAEPDERQRTEPEPNEADETQDANTGPSKVLSEEAVETPKERQQEIPELEFETGQVADTETAFDDLGTIEPIASLVTPTPKPVRNPDTVEREETVEPGPMTLATQLFTELILDDPRVRTAMADMPRSQRVNLLCVTEMRSQLETARPPRPPQYLPSFHLPAGNVLHPRQAAFLSQGQWFDFAFRCEVDEGATKVVKFNYRIGDAIPRTEWSRRGFPSF